MNTHTALETINGQNIAAKLFARAEQDAKQRLENYKIKAEETKAEHSKQ